MAAPNNSAPAIWVLDKLFSNSNCSSASMKVLQAVIVANAFLSVMESGEQHSEAQIAVRTQQRLPFMADQLLEWLDSEYRDAGQSQVPKWVGKALLLKSTLTGEP
jgi:hypothetical protein